MDYLEIINDYNRNIRSMSRDEASKIFHKQIAEYKKDHPYSTGFEFLYPDVYGWDENWLNMIRTKI